MYRRLVFDSKQVLVGDQTYIRPRPSESDAALQHSLRQGKLLLKYIDSAALLEICTQIESISSLQNEGYTS